jgi:ectoine hydroxylase-related dioxygenase (phytanoyl-CoA dioxygenase family)
MNDTELAALSDEQIHFFYTQGYLVLSTITTSEEIQHLQQAYDMLLALHTGCASTYQGKLSEVDKALKHERRIIIANPHRYHQAFLHTLFEANALNIAHQLTGNEVRLRESYILYKPAYFGAATPWHQEEVYLSSDITYNLMTFWLALQDTPEESGCMQFIPGSHKLKVLPHHRYNSNDSNIALAADTAHFDITRAISCPLQAGGGTIHTMRTLHYAGPNLSDIPRRAFILDIESLGAASDERKIYGRDT